jgi:hypothetical protein
MYRSILKDIEFGDAVASRGRQRGGVAGKDWAIAAADERGDVSSWQSHFLLITAWN